MLRHLIGGVVILILVFGMVANAQDTMKAATSKDMGKSEMTKETGKMEGKGDMGPLYSVSCEATCGWMMKTHDQKELTEAVKHHAKSAHNKKMSDKDVKAMMKMEGGEMK